jgi:hypothetical protein
MGIQSFLGIAQQTLIDLGFLVLNLIYLLVLLLVGFLIARLLQWLVTSFFEILKLDKGAQKIGFTPLLVKGEIKRSPSEVLGDLVYWFAIFASIIIVASFLGLGSTKEMVNLVLAYIPSVLSATLVLGFSIFIAVLLSTVVLVITANANLVGAKTLSRMVLYAVMLFGIIVALGQLGLDPAWLAGSASVVIGGVALAFAIAFGLGCKDIAGDFISKLIKGK